MVSLSQRLFRLLCFKEPRWPHKDRSETFQANFKSTILYFQRLGSQVDFRDKTVLDVGCGSGSACLYIAQQGARQVVGIDINATALAEAQERLAKNYSDLADRVTYTLISQPKQLGDQKFDIILSKDSFEHIDNPKQYLECLEEYVADDGIIIIGFGPLWKSPWGPHITYMTRFPWVHLLFSERTIMQVRLRMINPADKAETYAQVAGGLNQMTLKKFNSILKESNLEPVYFKTNVHDKPLAKVFDVLRRIPGCEEYFTFNLYSIWRLKTARKENATVPSAVTSSSAH